jgi:hypothetical protein
MSPASDFEPYCTEPTRLERWLDRIADSKALDVSLAVVIGSSLAAVMFYGLSGGWR